MNINKTDKEVKEIMEKGDKVVDALMDALNKFGDEKVSVNCAVYILAKFSARILLAVQEMTRNADVVDDYNELVNELMAIIGRDAKVQSVRNKIAENEKKIEEYQKQIAEEEQRIRAMVEEYLSKSLQFDDGIVN